ncbi:MAG: hypothetical protein ACRD2L_26660, partial [Terriglobia bacterium]
MKRRLKSCRISLRVKSRLVCFSSYQVVRLLPLFFIFISLGLTQAYFPQTVSRTAASARLSLQPPKTFPGDVLR